VFVLKADWELVVSIIVMPVILTLVLGEVNVWILVMDNSIAPVPMVMMGRSVRSKNLCVLPLLARTMEIAWNYL